MKKINFLGYASGLGAGNPLCADGPFYLKQYSELPNHLKDYSIAWEILQPNLSLSDKKTIIAELNQRLAIATNQSVSKNEAFVVVGGDHSSGIGTWSGVAQATQAKGDLGLIWIDAHLDAHTPETTPSGNLHGMPIAALLGYGDPALTTIAMPQAKIKPEHLCIIGARSFEDGEYELLKQLNVRVYFIEEVKQRGFEAVFNECLAHITQSTQQYGISFDIDGLDPIFVPGTGTPEEDGLDLTEVCHALKSVAGDPRFLGLEIAEYNPHNCPDNRTVRTICQLISACYS
ncbi:MAG: rocF [Gammaproteobacteria bacterium]|jgi:arginase|nr:rocF [Gammaproteobacteria bacterium]